MGKSTPIPLNGLQKVVIDAGHGGKDPGGMGKNSYEKNIALSIARLLAIGIRTNYPDVEVILTRSDDTFIPLYERADIANKAGADLFISIHANIMPGGTSTYGTETFVMGQHVAEQNLRVAKRENASILLESGDVTANYGYDPNSPEGHIMMTMQQHAFLERSILFAEAVERQFAASGRKSRGVKQAGFVVLKATTMPAVLVETGFMSNPNEEVFLLSDAGQQKLATSLLNAFGDYYRLIAGDTDAPVVSNPTLFATAPTPAPALPRPIPQAVPLQQESLVLTPVPVRNSQPQMAAVQRTTIFDKEVAVSSYANRQWTAKGVDPQPTPYRNSPVSSPQPVTAYYQPTPTPTPTPPSVPSRSVLAKEVYPTQLVPGNRIIPGQRPQPVPYGSPVVSQPDTIRPFKFKQAKQRTNGATVDLQDIKDSELLYAVQIIATERDLDLAKAPYRKLPYSVVKINEGAFNKYQIRRLATASDAKNAQTRAKALGFTDAMIVVYLNGQRLSAKSVNYLLNR